MTCFDTICYTYTNGVLTKTVDKKDNETVTTTYLYDEYGNTEKTTTLTEKDSASDIGIVECTYDVMGNMLSAVSGDESSSYIYDEAGRTLLADEKGDCTRAVYDSLGRIVQEIAPEDYDSTKDGLPESNTYADANAGHRYVYAENGTLESETNRLGKTTRYYYNDIGSKVREEFDLYKFYYLNHGELSRIKIADETKISYSYDDEYKLLSEQYANGDKIRYAYDEDGNLIAQYHNNSTQPYVTYTYTDGELTQKVNQDTGLRYVYSEENKVDVYRTSDNAYVQSYFLENTENEVTLENGDCFEYDPETGESYNIPQTNPASYTTVEEMHFGSLYTSVTSDKRVIYTAGTDKLEYGYKTNTNDDEDKMAVDYVKYNGSVNLSSGYEYDSNRNITHKVVTFGDEETLEVVNTYDSKDRIASTSYGGKTTSYIYDKDSQLTAVNGDNYSASYAYDSRGNITNKTVNGEETTFTYAENGWIDQLISVNDTELTYDANGNVLTYGDRAFTWNTGRHLEKIIDGDNEYSYTYNEDGIRTSKTVNGVTTDYNTKDGMILSQSNGTDTWYFQYDTAGIPLGFIYNGTQYFYITNQMGDVIGITDVNGNLIAQYEYDEWGNVSSISDNDIANANPIRYRGYYYDNETGYYYLQSRYYDPSICRFINADIPQIASICKDISVGTNLFAYCNNDPINKADYCGNFTLTMTAVYFGLTVIGLCIIALFYILTVSTSQWNGKSLRSWTSRRFHIAKYIPVLVFTGIILLAKKSKLSQKARATDAPSWISNFPPPHEDETGEQYAKRLCDSKYGKNNYKKGPGSEYNKIKKFAQRNLGLK